MWQDAETPQVTALKRKAQTLENQLSNQQQLHVELQGKLKDEIALRKEDNYKVRPRRVGERWGGEIVG